MIKIFVSFYFGYFAPQNPTFLPQDQNVTPPPLQIRYKALNRMEQARLEIKTLDSVQVLYKQGWHFHRFCRNFTDLGIFLA